MVLLEQTEAKLKKVRCPGMARSLVEYASNPKMQGKSNVEFTDVLVEAEIAERDANRYKRLKRSAGLKINAFTEDIEESAARGLDRQVMANLKQGDWLDKGQNLIITGPTGTGKTHFSCAFGNLAIKRDIATLYIRLSRLLEELEIAYGDGTLLKCRNKIKRHPLLIIDDWALAPMTERSRQQFFEVIDDRAGISSTIITSQLPVKDWHVYLGEATIADAILDRLVHSAHHIELKGESRRKLNAQSLTF